MVAAAPIICATIRPTNEIQAERTLFRFFWALSAADSSGASRGVLCSG